MPNWTGYVSRQELYDYCRSKVDELNAENRRLEAAQTVPGMEPEDLEAVDNRLALNYTKQLAYRDICEWATAHQVKSNGAETDCVGCANGVCNG